MTASSISLRQALDEGRLTDFISQEEERGIGPANQKQFDRTVKALATQPQSEGRTSRSHANGGSTEKRTR